jgi:CRISPR system Cascade subunit CasE
MYFSVIRPREGVIRQAAYEQLRFRPPHQGSAYKLHQWLWQFFPGLDGERGQFVFREYAEQKGNRYYLVSKHPPTPHDTAYWEVQFRAYDPVIKAGQRFAFELRANPVVSSASADGKKKRHDVVMAAKKKLLKEHGLSHWRDWQDEDRPQLYGLAQQEGARWLEKQGARCGFEILEVTVAAYQPQVVGRKKDSQGNAHCLNVTTMDFCGTLQVTDPVAFRQVLFDGLGHAKAFGCGLLLIKRL